MSDLPQWHLVVTLLVGGNLLLIHICFSTHFTSQTADLMKVWVCPEKLDSAFQPVEAEPVLSVVQVCVQNLVGVRGFSRHH